MKYKILVIIAAVFLIAMAGLATAAPTLTWTTGPAPIAVNMGNVNCGFTNDINVCRENIRQQLLAIPYVTNVKQLTLPGIFTPMNAATGAPAFVTVVNAQLRGTVFCAAGQTAEQCQGSWLQGPLTPAVGQWTNQFTTAASPGIAFDLSTFVPDTKRTPATGPVATVPGRTVPSNKGSNTPAPNTAEAWACSVYGQCR